MSVNLPPGPRYPGFVTLYLTQRHTKAILASSSKRYGDIFTIRLIRGKTIVFVSDPALIEEVFTADSDVLVGDAGVEVLVGKHSVLVSNGPEHAARRKLLMPAFQADQIARYRGVMERVCAEEIATWPLNEPVKLLPRFEKITLGVVTSAIFGVSGGRSLDTLGDRFADMLEFRDKPIAVAMMNVMPPGSKPPKSFLRVRDPFDAAVYQEIERARQDPRLGDRDDILATLLRAQYDDGSPLSDQEIRDHVVTMLLQGHISTATALSWAVERLVRHPEVLERLRAEAQTENDDYLDAVIKETLRVRPPVPVIVREVAKPFRLGGYDLDPGRLVAANAFGVQLREDLWPEPHRFRPERFLEGKPEKYTWIPFGGGVRHCIGRTFAESEMKYVLRTIMQQFRFARSNRPDEGTRRRGIGWIPADGGEVVIQERVPAVKTAGAPV